MAIEVRHETNPALLGQGAFAGGLAQYDRQREQLMLQMQQMRQRERMQQQAIESQSRDSERNRQFSLQNAAANAARQQGLVEQQNAIQQQRDAQRFQQEQLEQEQQQDNRIELSQQAYELKQNEMQAQIEWVRNNQGLNDLQKQEAEMKLRTGLEGMWKVKPEPTLQEQVQQEHFRDGNIIWTRGKEGRPEWKQAPPKNMGEERTINGRIYQLNEKNLWELLEGQDDAGKIEADKIKKREAIEAKRKKDVDAAIKAMESNPNYYDATPDDKEAMIAQWIAFHNRMSGEAYPGPSLDDDEEQASGPQVNSPIAGQPPSPDPIVPESSAIPAFPGVEAYSRDQLRDPKIRARVMPTQDPDWQRNLDEMNSPEELASAVETFEHDILVLLTPFQRADGNREGKPVIDTVMMKNDSPDLYRLYMKLRTQREAAIAEKAALERTRAAAREEASQTGQPSLEQQLQGGFEQDTTTQQEDAMKQRAAAAGQRPPIGPTPDGRDPLDAGLELGPGRLDLMDLDRKVGKDGTEILMPYEHAKAVEEIQRLGYEVPADKQNDGKWLMKTLNWLSEQKQGG